MTLFFFNWNSLGEGGGEVENENKTVFLINFFCFFFINFVVVLFSKI